MKKQNSITKSIKEIAKAKELHEKYSKVYVNEAPVDAPTNIYEAISASKKLDKAKDNFLRLIRQK